MRSTLNQFSESYFSKETIVIAKAALHLTHSPIGCGAVLRALNSCGLPTYKREQELGAWSMNNSTSAIAKTTSTGSDFENSFQPGGGSV